MRSFIVFTVAAIAMFSGVPGFCQLREGKLLVATDKSHDPDLKESVVLLIQYDQDAAAGLILNRRSTVPVAEVFPELANVKHRPVTVWAGGPVVMGLRALYQSPFQPIEARELPNGVDVITTKPLILKLVTATTPPDNFRLYAGYVGWTAKQLRGEVGAGLWSVRAGDANIVFDDQPETLWDRLAGKSSHKK